MSYADFITLLFAFFVVMFAASQVDQRKVGKIALAVQVAFQELGVFQATSLKLPSRNDGSLPEEKIQLIESIKKTTKLDQLVPSPNLMQDVGEDNEIKVYRLQLEKDLADSYLKEKIRMKVDQRGLTISLAEAAFFESGSAAIRANSYAILDKIGQHLLRMPNHIRIEGHTDNRPMKSGRFQSNWELSTARATYIVSYLIDKLHYPPDRLSAAGYAEFRPVATNDTPEGRALNRRVDVVVLNERAMRQEP